MGVGILDQHRMFNVASHSYLYVHKIYAVCLSMEQSALFIPASLLVLLNCLAMAEGLFRNYLYLCSKLATNINSQEILCS